MTTPSTTQLGPLATSPPSMTQATAETIVWGIDMTAELAAGQTVTSPTSTLVDAGTGAAVTLTDAPTVNGNIVSQRVRGSELAAGHTYLLTVAYQADANNELAAVLQITCPI